MTHQPPPLVTEITAVLTRLCACWNRLEPQAIAELWDPEEAEPFLLPQEIEQPLVGWEALRGYLRRAGARLDAASMRVWNVNVKLVAPDLAVALYEMHWNGLIRGVVRPRGVDSRATVLFRRRGETWRICHYVEAPISPSLHLQHRYLDAVDADFLERVGWKDRKGERFWPDGTPL